nr:MAG TPA: hypothetical protein [Caudoviricetes sp.]
MRITTPEDFNAVICITAKQKEYEIFDKNFNIMRLNHLLSET